MEELKKGRNTVRIKGNHDKPMKLRKCNICFGHFIHMVHGLQIPAKWDRLGGYAGRSF